MPVIGKSEQITYRCGHVETIGGNLADPTAQYSEAAGLKTFSTSEELCSTCSGKVVLPEQ